MNERIKELAVSKGIYDSICDPYDQLNNGDYYSSVMVDLERFALLIVQECCEISDEAERADVPVFASKFIKAHFGVE